MQSVQPMHVASSMRAMTGDVVPSGTRGMALFYRRPRAIRLLHSKTAPLFCSSRRLPTCPRSMDSLPAPACAPGLRRRCSLFAAGGRWSSSRCRRRRWLFSTPTPRTGISSSGCWPNGRSTSTCIGSARIRCFEVRCEPFSGVGAASRSIAARGRDRSRGLPTSSPRGSAFCSHSRQKAPGSAPSTGGPGFTTWRSRPESPSRWLLSITPGGKSVSRAIWT